MLFLKILLMLDVHFISKRPFHHFVYFTLERKQCSVHIFFMKGHQIVLVLKKKKRTIYHNISCRFPLKLLTIEMWSVTTQTWISVENSVDVLT